jgi:DNA-binding transcriptional LysR family regulator
MGNAAATLMRLADAHLDVAFVGRELNDPRYHFYPFNQAPLVGFTATWHPLAHRSTVPLAELVTHRLVLREAQSQTRRIFAQTLAANGLSAQHIFEVESREAVREAVAAGLGVGIVSAAELDSDGRLSRVDFADAQVEMTQYVAVLRERERLSVVRAFCAAAETLRTQHELGIC